MQDVARGGNSAAAPGCVIFLDLEALLRVARRTLGTEPEVRDYGLLESAPARPRASVFGHDVYTQAFMRRRRRFFIRSHETTASSTATNDSPLPRRSPEFRSGFGPQTRHCPGGLALLREDTDALRDEKALRISGGPSE